ncbi:LysR family transcriptional regulator [Photobacterium chitinilyticum]|uniref:LysR family transcriptional regulator n=1 Tax=Photobacterium chitinilyticum TaxID=2485123 RepID=A0A3S3QVC5_9GAMM|nr:LysR family transcriptional regulator [Photobacterium chitinilyticum]RWX57694.1 LysR family transcriptional regulator [Photobacterium chitinilyticum]
MNTSDLELFIRTADCGNITAAAGQLDTSPAAASAALKRLEKQLGVELFIRSTRQLRITAEGERFLLHCRQAIDSLEYAKASIAEMQGEIAGEIRMSVSSDLGRNLVLPWLDDVMDDNPQLSVQLSIGDSLADFYMDRVDVALRYGQPEDSSMVAFQLATVERIVCASPEYLERHGAPQTPEELLQHNCLLYRLGDQIYSHWEFIKKPTESSEELVQKIKVNSNRLCNDGDIVRRWAVAGKGIALKSRLDMSVDLKAGRVIELMPDYRVKPTSLWLICPSRKQVTPAVLLLRDMLREKCETLIGSDRATLSLINDE